MRLLDVLLAGLALLVLLPILIVCVIILKLSGEGEVFYLQKRIGKGGVHFHLLKFATMLKDSPNIGTGNITIKHDPRVLPFGRFLRKTKINELPQLINILRGEMSIIGPRPLTKDNFDAYDEKVKNKIISVQPGLSGIGSIVFRDEEKFLNTEVDALATYRDVIAPYKGELELWYVERKSLTLNIMLILTTLIVILTPNKVNIWDIFPSLPLPNTKLLNLMRKS